MLWCTCVDLFAGNILSVWLDVLQLVLLVIIIRTYSRHSIVIDVVVVTSFGLAAGSEILLLHYGVPNHGRGNFDPSTHNHIAEIQNLDFGLNQMWLVVFVACGIHCVPIFIASCIPNLLILFCFPSVARWALIALIASIILAVGIEIVCARTYQMYSMATATAADLQHLTMMSFVCACDLYVS